MSSLTIEWIDVGNARILTFQFIFFFFSSRRRHTRFDCDWSSDVCSTDLPPTLETVLIENADGPGPFGAKGVGESGTFCVAPAIGSALAQATGVRLTELPMTPERVWRALRDAERGSRPPTLT